MTGDEVRAAEVRAARSALGWSQSELAERASVGLRSIRRIEAGEAPTAVVANAVGAALRKAGVIVFRELSDLDGLEVAFGIAVLQDGASLPSKG